MEFVLEVNETLVHFRVKVDTPQYGANHERADLFGASLDKHRVTLRGLQQGISRSGLQRAPLKIGVLYIKIKGSLA